MLQSGKMRTWSELSGGPATSDRCINLCKVSKIIALEFAQNVYQGT